jgi:hypothetical protein
MFGIKMKDGKILPIVEKTEVEALQAAAKHLHGRKTAGAIGKMIVDGAKTIKVEVVESTDE